MDPYTDGLPAEKAKELDDFYKAFRYIFAPQQGYRKSNVLGVTDGDSWKNNFPVHGRTDYPFWLSVVT